MSNRRFTQFSYQLEKKVVNLFADFSVGVSNAITLNRAKGILSIVRSSAGVYTISFANSSGGLDMYQACLGLSAVYKGAIADAAPLTFTLSADNSTAGNIVMKVVNSSLAATDLAQNDEILLHIMLADTNVK